MFKERLLRFFYGITMVVAVSVVSILVFVGFAVTDIRTAFLILSFSASFTIADFLTSCKEDREEQAAAAYILSSTALLSSSVWIAYRAGFPYATTSESAYYSWYGFLALSMLSNCWSGWKWVTAGPHVPFCETVK